MSQFQSLYVLTKPSIWTFATGVSSVLAVAILSEEKELVKSGISEG